MKTMKSHGANRLCAQFFATFAAIALALSFALITPAHARKAGDYSASQGDRSTDRDNPTQLSSNRVSDKLDGSDDEYFYKFNAGPGKVTVTFDVKADGTNAGAYLDLFDANARPILSDILAQGVDRGSERIVKSVRLAKRQTIIMRIKGIRYGSEGGQGTYTVTLAGPVNTNGR